MQMLVGSRCEVDQKSHLFYHVISRQSVHLSAHRSGSQHGYASSYIGKLRTSSSLCRGYLPAPCAGSCSELGNLRLTPWEHQPSQGKNQPFASKKHWEQVTVQECETAQLAGGNNVYLMVSTICIYINLNTSATFTH